jgi:hypothetical protein
MYDVRKLGKFTLSPGAHEENDHRRCLMEAAIIAAGFKHRKVSRIDSCPPCFSPVFAGYGIMLNDAMPNCLRDELLMPFIVRMADTADTQEVEEARLRFIGREFTQRVNGYMFECLPPDRVGWDQTLFRDIVGLALIRSDNPSIGRILKCLWMPLNWWVRKMTSAQQRKIFTEATNILDEAMKGGEKNVKDSELSLYVPARCKVF